MNLKIVERLFLPNNFMTNVDTISKHTTENCGHTGIVVKEKLPMITTGSRFNHDSNIFL